MSTKQLISGSVGQIELAYHTPKDEALPFVAVVCHPHPLHGGTMDNKVVTTVIRSCVELAIPSVRFNFRGVGQSEGEHADAVGEQQDLLAVTQWMQQMHPGCGLVLAGFSFGSYVAYASAADLKPDALLLLAPPVHHYPFTQTPPPSCPWLVVQGDADEVVPSEQVYQWIDTVETSPTVVRMPEVGHFFHGQLITLRQHIQHYIRDVLAL